MHRFSQIDGITKRMILIGIVGISIIGALGAVSSYAGELENEPMDREEINQTIADLKSSDNPADLVGFLKSTLGGVTNDEAMYYPLTLELALAYYSLGNRFWAIRTLQSIPETNPAYLHAMSLRVWFAIQEANFSEATYLLEDKLFDTTSYIYNRKQIYLLYIEYLEHKEDDTYEPSVPFDSRNIYIYEEDKALFLFLKQQGYLHPYEIFRTKVDVSLGLSTNPYLTSEFKIDASIEERTEPYWQSQIQLYGVPFFKPNWHVFTQGTLIKSQFFYNTHSTTEFPWTKDRGISQLYLNADIGIQLTQLENLKSFKLLYKPGIIHLEAGDPYQPGGFLFRESHQLEGSLVLNNSIDIILNTGYTQFRQVSRSRFSVDLDMWLTHSFTESLHGYFLAGASGHHAHSDAFHLINAHVSPILLYTLHEWRILIKSMLYFDYYHASQVYYRDVGNEARMDLEWDNQIMFQYAFHPAWIASISYEWNRVFSTIPIYDSMEHKFFFGMEYRFSLNHPQLKPQVSILTSHFSYFDEALESNKLLPIEEIMKREEINRRESSCLNR